jgi:ethanolamine utilization microcompartment shell protein EutS
MAELRSSIFIDQLQSQTMCYLGTWIRGALPRSKMAAQIIEVAPGIDIEGLTDIALKHSEVKAGILIVERHFGYLEFHSRSTAAVKASADAVLDALNACPEDATKPEILASNIITRLDDSHTFLINRNRFGSMILPRESLYVLEMQPASYAIIAANEAEKAANIKIIEYRMIGASGRVYLAGEEGEVRTARDAAEQTLIDLGAGAGVRP